MNHLNPKTTKSGAPNWKERCLEAETKLIDVREKLSKQSKVHAEKILDYQVLDKQRSETIKQLREVIEKKNEIIKNQAKYLDKSDDENQAFELQVEYLETQGEVYKRVIQKMQRTQNFVIIAALIGIALMIYRMI